MSDPLRDAARSEHAPPATSALAPTFAQGARLVARQDAEFTSPTTGRRKKVRVGAPYWVASSVLEQRCGAVEVCKRGDPKGHGFHLTPADVLRLFSVEGEVRSVEPAPPSEHPLRVDSVAKLKRIPVGTRLYLVEAIGERVAPSGRTLKKVRSGDVVMTVDDPAMPNNGAESTLQLPPGTKVEARENGFAVREDEDPGWTAYVFAGASGAGLGKV